MIGCGLWQAKIILSDVMSKGSIDAGRCKSVSADVMSLKWSWIIWVIAIMNHTPIEENYFFAYFLYNRFQLL